jgi:DNA helicase IV
MSLDRTLQDERTFLEHARTSMRAMYEQTANQRISAGDEYAEEALRRHVADRLTSLTDDGETPLFFGRLDYTEEHELGGRTFHVGRRHIHDESLNPVVIDWRAPLARPFYRATPADPMGVSRRRRFGFEKGDLTSYETEDLAAGGSSDIAERALKREIERPRVGPMRDIVATIQPEQDELIRVGLEENFCIQGSPGTGKTAVGLHRAAYLLYEYRKALSVSGVLFVGPNRAFLSYIGRVLPGLGETKVTETTLDELVATVAVTGTDSPRVARAKSGAPMAAVVRRAIFGAIARPDETLAVRVHGRVLRLDAEALCDILDAVLAKGVPYDDARKLFVEHIAQRFVRAAERRTGISDAGREATKAVRASADVRALVKRTWPPMDPVAVVFRLLGDREHLEACAGDLLDGDSRDAVAWRKRPSSRKRAPWSRADTYLIDEAAALIGGQASFGHVVVDEAQDLSPMQLRAVGRRCRNGSVTLLGDLAQATAPWSVQRWETALEHLGKSGGRVVQLPRAFRAPRRVLDFANRLLPMMGVDLRPPTSVRDTPDALVRVGVSDDSLLKAVVDAVGTAIDRDGSIGVVTAPERVGEVAAALAEAGVDASVLDSFDASGRVVVLPATRSKGLEFDQVVLVEPAEIVEGDEAGLRWLYIALTRAVIRLVIVHSRPFPGDETDSG